MVQVVVKDLNDPHRVGLVWARSGMNGQAVEQREQPVSLYGKLVRCGDARGLHLADQPLAPRPECVGLAAQRTEIWIDHGSRTVGEPYLVLGLPFIVEGQESCSVAVAAARGSSGRSRAAMRLSTRSMTILMAKIKTSAWLAK